MSGSTIPTVIAPQGLRPLTPAQIYALIIAGAQAIVPGITNNLPGSLLDDITGTDTGAAIVMDQARVDVINSVTPLGANPFLLYQIGAIYGVAQGQDTNASVFLVFTGSSAGFIIPIGFTVSDGTNQYAVVDGGVVGTGLQTQPLFAVATNANQFAIPANSVTQIVTSVPTGYTLTVTNPLAGTPFQTAQTIADYRAQVLQAGLVASTGTPAFLKTLLGQVPGVAQNLISVRSVGSGWEIIVGGSGDPYLIAGAIYRAMPDLSLLVGSTLGVSAFTAANPGVVTTTLNHQFSTGQVVAIAGVSPGTYDGSYTITVLTEKTFSVGVSTSGFGAYVSGGVITPNFRNEVVSLSDSPDIYSIPYVIPPAQTVAMVVTWSTISPNFVSPTAVAQLSSAALAGYINGLSVGTPMNVDVMISVFQTAIAAILASALISALGFTVTINGVSTSPTGGTVLIEGDPESFFSTTAASIVVTQV